MQPDPRAGAALGPLPAHAGLDRALHLPRLPHPLTRCADPGGDPALRPRDLRRRRDRPGTYAETPAAGAETSTSGSTRCAGSATTAASSAAGTSTSPSARRPSAPRALRDVQLLLARPDLRGERVPVPEPARPPGCSAAVAGSRSSGRERIPAAGGAIIVANHESIWDPFVLGVATEREIHYLAKAELFRYRPLAAALRSLNAFPVERGSGDPGRDRRGRRTSSPGGAARHLSRRARRSPSGRTAGTEARPDSRLQQELRSSRSRSRAPVPAPACPRGSASSSASRSRSRSRARRSRPRVR